MPKELTLESYATLGALEMARAVADGGVSPTALLDCAVALAEELQPGLNCYTEIDLDAARTVAAEREAEQRAGRFRGPLHGLPLSIKDTYNVPGQRTGMGSLTTAGHKATDWSPLAGRVFDAGAVPFGRTTMPEFGWKASSTSPLTGVTRNPWNTALTTGGSSSGSAAAVAARIVPAALGGDGGGSIRIPASFCGLFGLKPSFGRIAVHPGSVHEQLVHHGFLTRTARDTAFLLDVGRGPDPRDPWSLPAEARSYVSILSEEAPTLRIGYAERPWGLPVDEAVLSCLGEAIGRLSTAAGFRVAAIRLPDSLPRTAFETLWSTSRAYTSGPNLDRDARLLDPALVAAVKKAARFTLHDYLSAQIARRRFASAFQDVFAVCDVVAMPTLPILPFAAEADGPDVEPSEEAVLGWIDWAPFTYPFNLSGNPAATLLAGFERSGLPVGLQLVGPRHRDDLVLQAAQVAEAALSLDAAMPGVSREAIRETRSA